MNTPRSHTHNECGVIPGEQRHQHGAACQSSRRHDFEGPHWFAHEFATLLFCPMQSYYFPLFSSFSLVPVPAGRTLRFNPTWVNPSGGFNHKTYSQLLPILSSLTSPPQKNTTIASTHFLQLTATLQITTSVICP